jgi:peptidoglycan/xylan/chitin deacetylase (PgdA/CDA1 family)
MIDMLSKIKYLVKLLIANLLYLTGILDLLKRIKLRNKAVVLMYHRVLAQEQIRETSSNLAIVVSTTAFSKQIRFLKKKFNIISLSEFEAKLDGDNRFLDYSCMLTFDDGWQDNFQNAFTILKEFQVPALIFLTTGYVGTNSMFWQDKLRRTLNRVLCDNDLIVALYENYQKTYNARNIKNLERASEQKRSRLIDEEINKVKLYSASERQQLLDDIAIFENNIYNRDNHTDKFLSWEEVRHLENKNVAFGSHGVSHALLNQLNNSDIQYEVSGSKHKIEKLLNNTVTAFAYPNGNYNSAVIKELKKQSYITAFSTHVGFVDHLTDPFKIPRINIQESVTNNIAMFYCKILGVF